MPEMITLGGRGALAHGGTDTEGLANVLFVVTLAVLAAAYCRGVHELWARRGTGAVVPIWRAGAFGAGIVALAATQHGPLHDLAERSFAGHMTQHMVLLVVVGPLLAAGAAGLPIALACPMGVRRRWARWRSGTLGRWIRRTAVFAVLAGTAQSLVLWAWHLPALYQMALENDLIHAAQHTAFLAGAWLQWSAVLGVSRHRLPGPAAVLLLFATMLPTSALGAVLTFAPAPLYPAGALAPTGGNPLADQQLAGLVMWIPMDVILLVAALAVFLRWFVRLDRTAPAGRDLQPVNGLDPLVREATR